VTRIIPKPLYMDSNSSCFYYIPPSWNWKS